MGIVSTDQANIDAHMSILCSMTAGVHTWCRTGDVQEAGEIGSLFPSVDQILFQPFD